MPPRRLNVWLPLRPNSLQGSGFLVSGNVITGPKCNKGLFVITFEPKCNKGFICHD